MFGIFEVEDVIGVGVDEFLVVIVGVCVGYFGGFYVEVGFFESLDELYCCLCFVGVY